MKGLDIIGNIAIVKFDRESKLSDKKRLGGGLLKENKSLTTILEKSGKFKGRLRKLKTKYIAGLDSREALYKENACVFRLNVDACYFSPRLSGERLEIAKKVKSGENVLVMFSGVAPYPVVIAKHSRAKKILGIELSKECNKYALQNIKRNKLQDKVEIIRGDVRKIVPKAKEKFDRIVMPRPNLKDSFLDIAFKKIKKNGIMHYYGFYLESESGKLKELINEEAGKAGKRIRILKVKKAGDIGMKKYRYRADFKVLN